MTAESDRTNPRDEAKRILFLSGVGRSGTSALVNVLNTHRQILIGQERYFAVIRENLLEPCHFEVSRFIDVRARDTHNIAALPVKGDAARRRYDSATYIGDKYPSLFRHFDTIFARFPSATHLYIVRNPLSVIESYDARDKDPNDNWTLSWTDGLAAWNESVGKVAALPESIRRRFILIQYENTFSSCDAINGVFKLMGLPPVKVDPIQRFIEKFVALNDKPMPRRDDLRMYIARHANWDAYRKICDIIDAGRQGVLA